MKILFLALLMVLSLSNCTTSQPGTEVASANEDLDKVVTPDGRVLVCTYEQNTGSHIKKKVCMTKAQREEVRSNSKEYIDRWKRHPEFKSAEPGR